MPGLRLHLHADRSGGPEALASDLPGAPRGTWPLAGLSIDNDELPASTTLSTRLVARGIAQGWISGENERPVVRPAGRTQGEWNSGQTGQPHVFLHYDALVFRTRDGDVRYRVVHQPDKYADHAEATYPDRVEAFDGDDDTPVTPEVYEAGATRVDHFYRLELEA